jgi:hypothetical protein
LKQQLNSLTIPNNGLVGTQSLNTHYPRLPYPNETKNCRKKENSRTKTATDSGHQKAKTTQELKQLLKTYKNDVTKTFLQGLTPTDSTDYSLWKVTKEIKQNTKSSPPLRTTQYPAEKHTTLLIT